jgi:LemA protein
LVLYFVIAIVVVVLAFFLKTYNDLVGLRNRLHGAWSDIDVQLTRRHDLIPSLVESVKGYMTHERHTMEDVTQARATALQTGADIIMRATAEMALGNALTNLFATVERYPQLKASQNFLLLQEQIASTENRIAFARQHYNEIVRQFNTRVGEFPGNLLATAFGFISEPLFGEDAGDHANTLVMI